MNRQNKAYFVENDIIIINRELTKLDMLVKDFLDTEIPFDLATPCCGISVSTFPLFGSLIIGNVDILKRHSDYLVVSGFVSISTGRIRGTEDIDILVQKINKTKFALLLEDLFKNRFWCYQGDTIDEIWKYIENGDNIRFAKEREIFPNIEFISVDKLKPAKYFELTHPQKIKIRNFEFKIPTIEFEILYKEIILAGKKDIEDAKHLRAFFSEIIKKRKI